ncbi:hypothetical protein [Ursidibacter maritimus]|nr:hypothetical protein [Ursidibacter maritimus]
MYKIRLDLAIHDKEWVNNGEFMSYLIKISVTDKMDWGGRNLRSN